MKRIYLFLLLLLGVFLQVRAQGESYPIKVTLSGADPFLKVGVSNLTNGTTTLTFDFGDGKVVTVNKETYTTTVYTDVAEVQIPAGVEAGATVTITSTAVPKFVQCDGQAIRSLDLSACGPVLQRVVYPNASLQEINLNGCSNLNYLRLDGNKLTFIDLSPCTSLATAKLANNNIAAIMFPEIMASNTTLTPTYDLSNNKLNSVNLSNLNLVKEVNLSGNNISSKADITFAKGLITTFNISNNKFAITELPQPTSFQVKNYNYKSQIPYVLPEKTYAKTVDLSALYTIEDMQGNPHYSQFMLFDSWGWSVASDSYEVSGSQLTIKKNISDSVYVAVVNDLFPSFIFDENRQYDFSRYRTTLFKALAEEPVAPTGDPVVTITSMSKDWNQVDNVDRVIKIQTNEEAPKSLRVDWGDGLLIETPLVNGKNEDGPTEITGKVIGETVKIYGTDNLTYLELTSTDDNVPFKAVDFASTVNALKAFVASKNQFASIDLSAQTMLETVDVSENRNLTSLIGLPATMKSINISNTQLTALTTESKALTLLDVSYSNLTADVVTALLEGQTNVQTLRVAGINELQIASLDLSNYTALTELVLSGAGLTSITLPTTDNLAKLDLSNNQLASIDLSKYTLDHGTVNLSNNLLTSYVGPKGKLQLLNLQMNKFNLKTLPLVKPGVELVEESENPQYFFGPQTIDVPEVSETGMVDLSEYAMVQGYASEPVATTFKIQNLADWSMLAKDIDYTVTNGVIKFKKAFEQVAILTVNKEAFPTQGTWMYEMGDYSCPKTNTFKTAVFIPTDPTATFVFNGEGEEEVSLDIRLRNSVDKAPIYIDWGDGTKVMTDSITNNATEVTTLKSTLKGNTVTLFGAEDVSYVKVIGTEKAHKLVTVNLAGMKYVQELDLTDNSLTAIDVTELRRVTKLALANNKITEIDLKNMPVLEDLNLSNNPLENKDGAALISSNTNLKRVNLSGIGLESIAFSEFYFLEEINLANNKLTQIELTEEGLKYVNLSNNNFVFGTLPVLKQGDLLTEDGEYIYAPQNEVAVEESYTDNADFSAYDKATGFAAAPQATVYKVKKAADNTELTLGTDYTVEAGSIHFEKAIEGQVYVEMTTPAFPGFDANPLKTTAFAVVVTGIDNVESTKVPTVVYNLSGVRVGNDLKKLPKGIYIVNGKKVVVK